MLSKWQSCNLVLRTVSCVARAALVIVFVLTVVATQSAQAQTYTVIHNFTGGADGAAPLAGLTMDRAGNLYGTTSQGGLPDCGFMGDCGTVFRLSRRGTGWILTSLYAFTGGNDGAAPQAGVLIGPDGSLYGTAMAAGGGPCQYQGYPLGCGTVFRLRPSSHALGSWTETTIHAFNGNGDGAYPLSGLVFDNAGNLYGTTAANDGSELHGVVYELTPSHGSWAENTLHTFTGSDGSYPAAGVIFDRSGNLYGTTADGGTYGYGTVFQLMPSGSGWKENILYNFDFYGSDGGMPVGGLIFDQQGNLYGTSNPGASVFMLSSSDGGWMFTLLYDNRHYYVGSGAGLVMDSAGNLYGTTESGGAFGFGNVFKLTPGVGGWTYISLHDFNGSDGNWPQSNVIFDAYGNLFGTASSDTLRGCGVVWEITP